MLVVVEVVAVVATGLLVAGLKDRDAYIVHLPDVDLALGCPYRFDGSNVAGCSILVYSKHLAECRGEIGSRMGLHVIIHSVYVREENVVVEIHCLVLGPAILCLLVGERNRGGIAVGVKFELGHDDLGLENDTGRLPVVGNHVFRECILRSVCPDMETGVARVVPIAVHTVTVLIAAKDIADVRPIETAEIIRAIVVEIDIGVIVCIGRHHEYGCELFVYLVITELHSGAAG